MRGLIISLPPVAIAAALLAVFGLVCFTTRAVVMRSCGEDAREEFADQAKNLLTGIAATFAFFVGFAISIGWGAVTAGQSAVEQQATAIRQMEWELRNIPDQAVAADLTAKLRAFVQAAATEDDDLLARGLTTDLPSTPLLDDFENALRAYVHRQPEPTGATGLLSATSAVVSASAGVAAVANRSLPQPLAALLFLVAILVSAAMGISTVSYGRQSLIFVGVWCLVPALSLTVVLALAYPFALRTGLTLAPLRAVAQSMGISAG